MTSNAIIVNGERVSLPADMTSAGYTASNYMDDDEPRFAAKKRVKPLVHFVLHETCGNTALGCKKSLFAKGYGVHLILSEKGHISCHGDLARDVMVHANQCNATSIGMEVVNPYTRLYVQLPFGQYIQPQWWTWTPSVKAPGVLEQMKRRNLESSPRGYVLPLPEQIDVVSWFVPWVCKEIGIPVEFPTVGLNAKKTRIDGWKKKALPGKGIVAHQDFSSHADGRYLLDGLISMLQ